MRSTASTANRFTDLLFFIADSYKYSIFIGPFIINRFFRFSSITDNFVFLRG